VAPRGRALAVLRDAAQSGHSPRGPPQRPIVPAPPRHRGASAMSFLSELTSATSVGWSEDIGLRDEMEDGFVYVDAFGDKRHDAFFGIYDGHGGRQCVDYIMTALHESLIREMQEALQGGGDLITCISGALVAAFRGTDERMFQSGITMSGCTACTCLLYEDLQRGSRILFTAHLGDARAVLCRNGGAMRLTSLSDHKATDGEEMLRVQRAGGVIMNDRVNGMLAISRAFGDHQLKAPNQHQDIVSNEPSVSYIDLTSEDNFLIVACDGLWDVLSDQEAVTVAMACVRAWTNLAVPQGGQDDALNRRKLGALCARCLVEEALARRTSDNVSCLVCFPH